MGLVISLVFNALFGLHLSKKKTKYIVNNEDMSQPILIIWNYSLLFCVRFGGTKANKDFKLFQHHLVADAGIEFQFGKVLCKLKSWKHFYF